MLYSQTTPAKKRRAFRERLATGELLRFPGAFNPLSARLIERKGFEGVYISGAVLSADLGLPDIGLTTLTEVAGRAKQVARMTELPAIVDADTGFGEPMNVARTDIRALEGLGAAIDRAKQLVDAGADAIFPEAMKDLSEFEAVASALDVPVLANMTEFGKSELFTAKQLHDAGAQLVIYPVTLLRIAMGAAERALEEISASGTQDALVPQMQTRARLYELTDYAAYNHFDSNVFTYKP